MSLLSTFVQAGVLCALMATGAAQLPACVNTQGFSSEFGSCSTYAAGLDNHQFCSEDTDQTNTSLTATIACPQCLQCSCATCPPPAPPPPTTCNSGVGSGSGTGGGGGSGSCAPTALQSQTSSPTAPPQTSSPMAGNPTPPLPNCDVTVITVGLSFSPAIVNINVGQTVCFLPGPAHNVVQSVAGSSCTAITNPIFGSTQLGNPTFHTFTQPGSFFYMCIPHCSAQMTGEINVVASSTPPTTASPSTAPIIAPTTFSPTTAAPAFLPTTSAPTAIAPMTSVPSATPIFAPTTLPPSTSAPFGPSPTTNAPETSQPNVAPSTFPTGPITSFPTGPPIGDSPTTSSPAPAFSGFPTSAPVNESPTTSAPADASPTPFTVPTFAPSADSPTASLPECLNGGLFNGPNGPCSTYFSGSPSCLTDLDPVSSLLASAVCSQCGACCNSVGSGSGSAPGGGNTCGGGPTAPPSPTAPPAPNPPCLTNITFDSGFGGCSTYAPGSSNNQFCPTDTDSVTGIAAGLVCAECGQCVAAPTTSAPTPPPNATPAPVATAMPTPAPFGNPPTEAEFNPTPAPVGLSPTPVGLSPTPIGDPPTPGESPTAAEFNPTLAPIGSPPTTPMPTPIGILPPTIATAPPSASTAPTPATQQPTLTPVAQPSVTPTSAPTTSQPTAIPTSPAPTSNPTTRSPTPRPTRQPTTQRPTTRQPTLVAPPCTSVTPPYCIGLSHSEAGAVCLATPNRCRFLCGLCRQEVTAAPAGTATATAAPVAAVSSSDSNDGIDNSTLTIIVIVLIFVLIVAALFVCFRRGSSDTAAITAAAQRRASQVYENPNPAFQQPVVNPAYAAPGMATPGMHPVWAQNPHQTPHNHPAYASPSLYATPMSIAPPGRPIAQPAAASQPAPRTMSMDWASRMGSGAAAAAAATSLAATDSPANYLDVGDDDGDELAEFNV